VAASDAILHALHDRLDLRRRRAGTGIGIGDDIVNSIFDRF
jgi:hypothetical protein